MENDNAPMTSKETAKTGERVPRTRRVVIPIVVTVVVAVIGAIFIYRDSQMRDFLNSTHVDNISISKPEARTTNPSVSLPSPETLPLAMKVQSYLPGQEYPLSDWEILDDPGGFVDAVFVNGELIGLDEIVDVRSGDVIHMTGWAGHRLLGMNFAEVLFSICGNVIGAASVSGMRSDIADSVHPNLQYSGWEADLYATDLPNCDDATIMVWGRPSVGWTLRPVLGERRIKYVESATTLPVNIIHEEPLVRPEDARIATTIRLSIHHDNTTLHMCARSDCDVTATLPQGALSAVIVEKSAGWVLLQSASGSGWTAVSEFRALP